MPVCVWGFYLVAVAEYEHSSTTVNYWVGFGTSFYVSTQKSLYTQLTPISLPLYSEKTTTTQTRWRAKRPNFLRASTLHTTSRGPPGAAQRCLPIPHPAPPLLLLVIKDQAVHKNRVMDKGMKRATRQPTSVKSPVKIRLQERHCVKKRPWRMIRILIEELWLKAIPLTATALQCLYLLVVNPVTKRR